jgi:hypothetical protein
VTYLFDADDLQDGPQTEPEPLRDLIVAQGMQETGIFVLLFTSETTAASGDSADPRFRRAADLVERKAGELAVNLSSLSLFSDEAYLLQAALGEAVTPEAGTITAVEPA